MTSRPTRPNVVFIVSDQHNAKVLGCAGHPDVKTPNLDRMAAEGVRFDAAICQNPICTPSRVSFLSGQYPHNHGYYGLEGPNPDGLPTILGHFRRHGYRTAAIGKIHCPEYWVEDDCDVFHETCNCSVDGRSRRYEDFLQERGKLEQEDHLIMNDLGARGRQSMEGRPSTLSFEESQEGWITSESLGFMQDSAQRRQPFLAYLSLPRPHQCTAPSEPFWSMYSNRELALPPNADYDMAAAGKAPHLIERAAGWRTGDWTLLEPRTFEAGRRRKLQGYLGAISQVDHAVGRVIAFLESAGLDDETIVVYTSDHGDYACEHGIMEKAPGICSDAITRVPLIWRWPGRLKAGHVAREVVELVDISQTLCHLAGLAPLETSDGRVLDAPLRGDAGDASRCGFTEFAWSKSIRRGDHRLIYYPREQFADVHPDGFGELYDLRADPWEMHNLYHDPGHADLVRELTRELTDWLVCSTRPRTVLRSAQPANDQHRQRYHHRVLKDGKVAPEHVRLMKRAQSNYL